MSTLYSCGYWIPKQDGRTLGNLLYRFLSQYSTCASITLQQHKRRFPMHPKCHMIAHTAHLLISQSMVGDWVENPLATANQLQEDYIGRPARISRRVNIRSIHKSLMMRSLIVYQESLIMSDSDRRGLDGYSGL